jgi:hypothetical protein
MVRASSNSGFSYVLHIGTISDTVAHFSTPTYEQSQHPGESLIQRTKSALAALMRKL